MPHWLKRCRKVAWTVGWHRRRPRPFKNNGEFGSAEPIRCRFSTYWPKASLAVPLRDTQRALRNFPAADIEVLLLAVEVLQVQCERFANADSRAIEKPQKGPVGVGPKRVRRRQFCGGRQQPLHLADAIDVRPAGVLRADSPAAFGDVTSRVGPREVLAELPDHAQAVVPGPGVELAEGLLIRLGDLPCQTRLRRQPLHQEPIEVQQQSRLGLVIGTSRAPQLDEALQLGRQTTVKLDRSHFDTSCGHSKATCFRALKSTLV